MLAGGRAIAAAGAYSRYQSAHYRNHLTDSTMQNFDTIWRHTQSFDSPSNMDVSQKLFIRQAHLLIQWRRPDEDTLRLRDPWLMAMYLLHGDADLPQSQNGGQS